MDRQALQKISYGLYVVSSTRQGKHNGQIANAVCQVTAEPPQIAFSINKQNLTHEFIQESKILAASILAKTTPLRFIANFGFWSGRDRDKFKDVKYEFGVTGAPLLLENTIARMEVEIFDNRDAGTHTVFIGKAVNAEVIKDEEVMTYAYYHRVKHGGVPKTAPTYLKP